MEAFSNTITKRLGLLVLGLGVIVLICGLYAMGGSHMRAQKFFESWFEVVLWDRNAVRRNPAVLYGSYMVLAGLLLSILYDKVTGRLVNWILTGNVSVPERNQP